MRILVITPIYNIEGRKELFHDSSAIHYLFNLIAEHHDVYVLNTYFASIRELSRFIKKDALKYFIFGYQYNSDNVKVEMIETQLLYKQVFLTKFQQKRLEKKICVIVNERNPNIICVHFPTSYYGVLNKALSNTPMIAILHQTDINRIKKYSNKEKLINYLNKNFLNIYARSHRIANEAKNLGLEVSDRIIFSGVSVDNSYMIENKFINNYCIRNLFYAGKLIKRKNLDLILSAFLKLEHLYPSKKLTLSIAGDGNQFNYLKSLAHYSSNIRFLGSKSRNEVLQIMSSSDVFIMPSVNETFGIVYLEAMSRGCITIGTKGEGIDGIIEDGINGFLVSPNEKDIFCCLEKVINLESWRLREISKSAINTAKKYNSQAASDNYEEIIFSNLSYTEP
ncbi:MAG: glycosyltransferase family 4 protein [Chloroherpetonaceae bacterium]